MALSTTSLGGTSAGAAPASLTCTDSGGNTYGSPVITQLVDPGAASAGTYLAIFSAPCTVALTTSSTITITTGSSAAIGVAAMKITAAAGSTILVGPTSVNQATAAASITT